MTTEQDIIDRSREILSGKVTFVTDDSQFIEEISTFLGVGVNKAAFEAQSSTQEFFSETAQLRSSKLAKASDEGRVPNMPVPQKIRCRVYSKGQININPDDIFTSEIGTKYFTEESITIDDSTDYIELYQEIKTIYTYQATGLDWQKCVAGGAKTSRFEVYVNSELSQDYQSLGRLPVGEYGYVTKYNILEELFVMFGNGFLGKLPEGEIRIISYDTESVDIMVGAPLLLEGTSEDVEIEVTEILRDSQVQESAESVSNSLPFWRLKVGGSGYRTDYIQDIIDEFPETISIEVWSEKRATTTFDRDNINVIFVSALREENQETFGAEIIAFLNENEYVLQVSFEWKEPILETFSVLITGKIERSKNITDAKTVIKQMLDDEYGLYAVNRKYIVFKSEIEDVLIASEVFKNLLPNKSRNERPGREVELSGSLTPSGYREIIYLPQNNITFDITHVSNA